MRRLLLLLLACGLAVPAAACNRGSGSAPAADLPPGAFAPALNVDTAAMTRTPSGLLYRDLAPGAGEPVRAGQTVSVHYRGSLPNGTEFDANQPGDDPLTFTLGRQEVIAGWDEGVAGMRPGGKRQLVIPPALGYGEQGIGPIPGNATLVFEVELVSAQ